VSALLGTPKGASGVATAKGLHTVALASDSASGLSYAYTNTGISGVQEDVVDRHGTAVYFIELDTERALQSQGEAALTAFMGSGAWTS